MSWRTHGLHLLRNEQKEARRALPTPGGFILRDTSILQISAYIITRISFVVNRKQLELM